MSSVGLLSTKKTWTFELAQNRAIVVTNYGRYNALTNTKVLTDTGQRAEAC